MSRNTCRRPQRADFGELSRAAIEALEGRRLLTITVNTLVDEADGSIFDGDISLRDAIAFSSAGETINFSVTGAISLVLGEVAVQDRILQGPGIGALIINAHDASRVFDVGGTTTLFGMTITGGSAIGGAGINGQGTLTVLDCFITDNGALNGGGILHAGPSLTVVNSIISGNRALTAGPNYGAGGGIYSAGGVNIQNSEISGNTATRSGGGIHTSYMATITNSLILNNTASRGGGIRQLSGTLTVTNSRIHDNTATSDGGGIIRDGGSSTAVVNSTISDNTATGNGGGINGGPVTITNSTISGNTAAAGGGLFGDGQMIKNSTIANNTGGGGLHGGSQTALINTIVAGNTAGATPRDVNGSLNPASSNNLIGDAATAGGLTNGVNGNIVGVDPRLGPLAGNGGSTPTHALLPDSPAINAAAADPQVTTDQRGISRPQGPAPDIGAFERQGTTAALTGMSYEFETRQAVKFSFNGDASVTFSRSSYSIQNLTSGQTVPSSTGALSFNSDGTQATLVLTNLLPDGNYRVSSPAVRSEPGLSLNFLVFAGDANGDRTIDIGDFAIVAGRFNQPGTFSQGDFNYDALTDIGDFAVLASKFNTNLPAARQSPATATSSTMRAPLAVKANDEVESLIIA